MPDDNDPIPHALFGQRQVLMLIQNVAKVEERLANLIDEYRQDRHEAREERASHKTMLDILSGSMRELNNTMTEIKPLVMDYREKRAEHRGAARLKSWILAVAVSASSICGAIINEIWKAITHGQLPRP